MPAVGEKKEFRRGELIAVILYLFAQFCTSLWWASKMDARISALEAVVHDNRNDHVLIGVLDERTKDMQKTLDHVNSVLESNKDHR